MRSFLSLVGAAYARLGEYDEANDFHRRHLAIARCQHDDSRIAEGLSNLAMMYYLKGEYAQAEARLVEAVQITEEIGPSADAASIQGNYAFILMRLNRLEDAKRAFAHAIETTKLLDGAMQSLIPLYNGMGDVLVRLGKYDEARTYFQRALPLALESNDRVNEGVAHMNLARCYVHLGDTSTARHQFDAAFTAYEGTGFLNGIGLAYEYQSEMYLAMGNGTAALDCASKALEIAGQHDNQVMKSRLRQLISRAQRLGVGG